MSSPPRRARLIANSVLMASAAARVAIALVCVVLLWGAVVWALVEQA